MHHLGIDISKRTFDVTLRTETGEESHCQFENHAKGFTELEKWLASNGVDELHACMEATNIYWEDVADHLYSKGYQVSVVNPSRTKGYGMSQMQRNKTDKADSKVIAAFCAATSPDLWYPPTAEQRKLRALVRHRDALTKTKTQQKNRLTDCRDEDVKHSLNTVISILDAEIKQIEKQIREYIKQTPALQEQRELLLSIPGFGDVVTHVLMAEMYDLANYDKAHAAAADAGLNPSHYESGETIRKRPKLSKIGKPLVRSVLFMPAMTAIRYNSIIAEFAQRLEQRGKPKMVIIGAVMRKLLHIAYGVLKNKTPFDPHFHSSRASHS